MKKTYFYCSSCHLYIPLEYAKNNADPSINQSDCPICGAIACHSKELMTEEEMFFNLLKSMYEFVNNESRENVPCSLAEIKKEIKELIPAYLKVCEDLFYKAVKRNAEEENSIYASGIANDMIKVVENYEKIFNISIIKDVHSTIKENIMMHVKNNEYPTMVGCDSELLSKYVPTSALYDSYEKHIKRLTDWNMMIRHRYVDNRLNLLIHLLNLSPVEIDAELK